MPFSPAELVKAPAWQNALKLLEVIISVSFFATVTRSLITEDLLLCTCATAGFYFLTLRILGSRCTDTRFFCTYSYLICLSFSSIVDSQ